MIKPQNTKLQFDMETEVSQWKQTVFSASWRSYISGNFPSGAIILNSNGECISMGSNRTNFIENIIHTDQVQGSQIAHAEINALYKLGHLKNKLECFLMLCSHEPCPMCTGALHNYQLNTLYFARDPHVQHSNIEITNLKILNNGGFIRHIKSIVDEAVFTALQTDYLLRTSKYKNEKRSLLCNHSPHGVELGENLFKENFFENYLKFNKIENCFEYLLERIYSVK